MGRVEGRAEGVWDSTASALAEALAKAPEELGVEDALVVAVICAMDPPATTRGYTRALDAGFGDTMAHFAVWFPMNPVGL